MPKYTGMRNMRGHVTRCMKTWKQVLKQEWTHRFIHTPGTVPRNWYQELEVHRQMMNWEELIQNFKVTFTFEAESPLVDVVLQVFRGIFFMREGQG
jgi:hypothetical protein